MCEGEGNKQISGRKGIRITLLAMGLGEKEKLLGGGGGGGGKTTVDGERTGLNMAGVKVERGTRPSRQFL